MSYSQVLGQLKQADRHWVDWSAAILASWLLEGGQDGEMLELYLDACYQRKVAKRGLLRLYAARIAAGAYAAIDPALCRRLMTDPVLGQAAEVARSGAQTARSYLVGLLLELGYTR